MNGISVWRWPRALSRTGAMFIKEFLQLRRDRLTFGTMIFIPIIQLTLFGFAINTTPRHLPTAVLAYEDSDIGRSILAALNNTSYFKLVEVVHSEAEMDHLMRSGQILFGVEIRQTSSARCGAATGPRCLWLPMRPIRSPRRRRLVHWRAS